MTTYKIIKTETETGTGRIVPSWNVEDSDDGYVFDSFSRKCDAVYWIEQAKKAQQ